MDIAHRSRIAERDLAEINARAEASLPYDDEAWDDAVRAADDACASLCESLRAGASRDLD